MQFHWSNICFCAIVFLIIIIRYFIISVLKDVPSISLDMLRSPEKDSIRTSLFPSLDYKTLHNALVELVDAVPLVQHGAHGNILTTI